MVATRAEWRVESDNNDGDTSVGVARSVESSKGVETGGDLGARGTDADERDPNIRGIMLASAASSFATLPELSDISSATGRNTHTSLITLHFPALNVKSSHVRSQHLWSVAKQHSQPQAPSPSCEGLKTPSSFCPETPEQQYGYVPHELVSSP